MSSELANELFEQFRAIPIFDTHSHIDPFAPTAKSLDDLLNYHYFTELAHSAGLPIAAIATDVDPRERCRAILSQFAYLENTSAYSWMLEIARKQFGFAGDTLRDSDADSLFDAAATRCSRPDWTDEVVRNTNLECVFLTNSFDDRLTGFDSRLFVPCLRTDDLVFHSHMAQTRTRWQSATGTSMESISDIRAGLRVIFERFVAAGARACAISLPPGFRPEPANSFAHCDRALLAGQSSPELSAQLFWLLAEHCREFCLPFDLMIGVNRQVYPAGVFQGQDLFDCRCSLIEYAQLFNAFPEVTFPVSVLTSGPVNQELVSYSWIFPNVLPHGHWWYSNVPAYIEPDLRARLGGVPNNKLLGYYSDAYKLEFILPKYNMYRRLLADTLARDFVEPRRLNVERALGLGRAILRGNGERVFGRPA
ncbi:MAG: glucuronate isomerase [Gemmataceae bacterium]|nr:glucuronate isomerase [Gemmataceae bacterium]